MKLEVLLLTVTGIILIDKTKNSFGQLIPVYPVEVYSDSDTHVTPDQKNRSFTSKELKDIYHLAKNISHRKGHITESETGDPEYRRSYIRKVIKETKFEALKLWFAKHHNSTGEFSVSDLQDLEHLVHQYETAIDFVKLGGMEFLLPLVNHGDPKISSAALSVLTAAMQGNPSVQKYAEDAQILYYILRILKGVHRRSTTTALYTLSSFIRNNPVSQLSFFKQDGINILAGILKSNADSLKSKLKVLDLIHDLAYEIYMGPVTAYESPKQLALLKRSFSRWFSNSNLCKMILKYLDFNDIFIHEKTISVMNHVAENVCLKEFTKLYVIKIIEQLLQRYDERKTYDWLMEPNTISRRRDIWFHLHDLYYFLKTRKDADGTTLK